MKGGTMHQALLHRLNVSILLLPTVLLLFPHLSWSGEFNGLTVMEKPVTIDCQGVAINDVLGDISRQSGLEINYDQKLKDEPIMPVIPFNDEIKAIDAVVRLLRGRNTIIEFNIDQKNIDIRLFENFN